MNQTPTTRARIPLSTDRQNRQIDKKQLIELGSAAGHLSKLSYLSYLSICRQGGALASAAGHLSNKSILSILSICRQWGVLATAAVSRCHIPPEQHPPASGPPGLAPARVIRSPILDCSPIALRGLSEGLIPGGAGGGSGISESPHRQRYSQQASRAGNSIPDLALVGGVSKGWTVDSGLLKVDSGGRQ